MPKRLILCTRFLLYIDIPCPSAIASYESERSGSNRHQTSTLKLMIDKKTLTDFVESQLQGTGYLPVDITVSPDNIIEVEIVHPDGVNIDFCVELTRAIEAAFDRDIEDYELQVGSAGLTSPFKIPQQYALNRGNEVEVLTKSGEKLKGVLGESNESSFAITMTRKVKKEGAKRTVMEEVVREFNYNEIKYTKCLLSF
jgi:ribosome maturation factor RimP